MKQNEKFQNRNSQPCIPLLFCVWGEVQYMGEMGGKITSGISNESVKE